MYKLGDKIVHPMHGAGIIDDIITQNINGQKLDYYIMKLIPNNMTIMIPISSCEKIGIRDVISPTRADELLLLASTIEVSEEQNWNKRFRDNATRIKSGELDEVIKVIKSLVFRDTKNGLSTGERKMLHSAKQILISELVLAKNKPFKEIEQELSLALSSKKIEK